MSATLAHEPLTPARLLAAAAVLRFRPTSRDRSGSTLGVLVDAAAQKHLAIGPDGVWTLEAALPPKGLKPVLLYESAANVLRGGDDLNADGSISYQGGSYVIESSFDGTGWTAKVGGSA